MPDQPKTPPKAPAIIAIVVLLAAPITMHFEGYRGKAYNDVTGHPTVCYGDTANVNPYYIYSADECATRLRQRLAHDYAPYLAKCMPQIANTRREYVFAALLDASYNAGWAAVCRSPMAKDIHSGNWAGACAAFPGWYVTSFDKRTGQHVLLKGLVLRRQYEAAVCRKGI